MSTSLITHCGARVVTREQLDLVEPPPPTATWLPVKHSTVVDTVTRSLSSAGFAVERVHLALARGDARLFATLDLASVLADGVRLACGVRSSTDKSLPLGFCAGSRVFVCDNLAFRSDLLIRRKHTRFGATRFEEAIALAARSLVQFQEVEARRVGAFRLCELAETNAESMILRAYEGQVVSHRLLPRVLHEWRTPSFEEFHPRTLWSLLNAFTTVLAERRQSNPQWFAAATMRLQALLEAEAGLTAPATAIEAA